MKVVAKLTQIRAVVPFALMCSLSIMLTWSSVGRFGSRSFETVGLRISLGGLIGTNLLKSHGSRSRRFKVRFSKSNRTKIKFKLPNDIMRMSINFLYGSTWFSADVCAHLQLIRYVDLKLSCIIWIQGRQNSWVASCCWRLDRYQWFEVPGAAVQCVVFVIKRH